MPACPHPADSRERLFVAKDYITGDPFEICRCVSCGFVVTWPQPEGPEMARYYPAAYYGSERGRRFPAAVEWLQQMLYAFRARRVESLAGGRKGRVLDIGCGRGWLLRAFQRRGWEVHGTELSEASAAFARDVLKIPVHIGPADQLPWPPNNFDAVTMWHVLEHLSDPRGAMNEVARVLRPSGVFLASVPNFSSVEARLTTDKWFHLDVPRHLTHLTRKSLSTELAEAGFELRRTSFFALEYDCFSFTQSALNRLGLRHNLLYNLLRGRGAKVLREEGVSRREVFLTLLLSVPLGLLSVPATLLAALARSGATITIAAVRRNKDGSY